MSRVPLLGVLGMIGGVIYMLAGVRMLAFGYGKDRLAGLGYVLLGEDDRHSLAEVWLCWESLCRS